MDALGGRCADRALSGQPGQPDEHRGVPGHRGSGRLAADGPDPAAGQHRRPHGEAAEPPAGGAVSGEPVHIPGSASLFLRRGLHRGPV